MDRPASRPVSERNARRGGPLRRLDLVLLALGGAGLIAGGVLHPGVPDGEGARMGAVAGHARWAPSHWVLTLAQLAAVVGLMLACASLRPLGRVDRTMWAGLLLAAIGLLVGALGTLLSATVLVTLARGPDADLFQLAEAITLAVGWLCLVTAASGGALVGACLVRARAAGWRGLFGWAALGGTGVFLAASLALGPSHTWMHPYVLRWGAVGMGVLLLVAAAGWWRPEHREA